MSLFDIDGIYSILIGPCNVNLHQENEMRKRGGRECFMQLDCTKTEPIMNMWKIGTLEEGRTKVTESWYPPSPQMQ